MTFFKNCRDDMMKSFDIEMLNFTCEPEKFIEETTNDYIKVFLPPNSITPFTEVVLVNTAFFEGIWKSKFRKSFTQKKIFYKNGHQPVYIDMMGQKGFFNYGMIC